MSEPNRWMRAIGAVRPHRRAALAILALTLSAAASGAPEPLLYERILDGLAGGRHAFDDVVPWALVLGAIALGRELIGASATWLTWKTRLALTHRLLDATVTRLHRLPLDVHCTRTAPARS